MDAEKMMMQKRIDNLCEQVKILKNKLEEEKTNHQHTLECAEQFEKEFEQMKRERDAACLKNRSVETMRVHYGGAEDA